MNKAYFIETFLKVIDYIELIKNQLPIKILWIYSASITLSVIINKMIFEVINDNTHSRWKESHYQFNTKGIAKLYDDWFQKEESTNWGVIMVLQNKDTHKYSKFNLVPQNTLNFNLKNVLDSINESLNKTSTYLLGNL